MWLSTKVRLREASRKVRLRDATMWLKQEG